MQDLRGLNIAEIYLENVDLSNSNLLDTDMSNAVIINTKIKRSFEYAFYNNNTRFPDDFDLEDQGMYLIEPRLS